MAHKSIVDRVLMVAAAVCAAALVWQLTVLLTSKRTPTIGRAVAASAPAAAEDSTALVAAPAPSPAIRVVYPGTNPGKTSLKATDLPAAPPAGPAGPAPTLPTSSFKQAAAAPATPPRDGTSSLALASTPMSAGEPAPPAAPPEGPGSAIPDQADQPAARASVDVASAEVPAPADSAPSALDAKPTADGTIDLNHASAETLNHLKGAGRIGQAIVSHRPYRSVEDLVKKRVLRRDVYEQIKEQVVIQ